MLIQSGCPPGLARHVLGHRHTPRAGALRVDDVPEVDDRVLDWPAADVRPVGPPLTDDWAPVESLQARMILEGIRWR